MKFVNAFKTVVSLQRQYATVSKNNVWETVVGLEIHAQINSRSKLFSGASTKFVTPVNRNVALFDCGIPGTLPVLNKRCVEAAVLTALALNCKINAVSRFDRKHYFYADLPTGYQITQQSKPLAYDGYLEFQVFTPGVHKKPYKKKVKLKQLQLEQDSGRTLHADDRSLIDLNRSGAPLMELVFDPQLSDSEEATALVKELVLILERLNTCTCKMEEGALRVDVNVSVNKKGEPLGVRTEIKNIGSIRAVSSAIQYESKRQIKTLDDGGIIINETRAWNADSKATVSMRDKEDKVDYRYMPEPNLPFLFVALGPIAYGCVNVDEIKQNIPELPEQTRINLQNEKGLTVEQSIILVNDNHLLLLFKSAADVDVDTKLLANILINDFLKQVHKMDVNIEDMEISAKFFKELAIALKSGLINRITAELVIKELLNGNTKTPLQIIEERNWTQISDDEELTKLCIEVLEENKNAISQYKAGKTKVFKNLLGSVVVKSNQRANMAKSSLILKKLLEKM